MQKSLDTFFVSHLERRVFGTALACNGALRTPSCVGMRSIAPRSRSKTHVAEFTA
jgi:hypothetical protein